MIATAYSATLHGIRAEQVRIEVDIARGLPAFDLVGLPGSAVRESRGRVRSAIRNSGYPFPLARITVNLAPGDIRKVGPQFDLPIVVGNFVGARVHSARRTDALGASRRTRPRRHRSTRTWRVLRRR